ncbi:MAG: ABC transporter permease [Chloroflexi bacterium]|nr:ABC transporter permease [Chloroflexota bacterium]
MTEQAQNLAVPTTTLEMVQVEVEAQEIPTPRPDLRREAAGVMTLLFLIITYHIQHPFMLFRVQFGEGFRDVRQEGLQEAMFVALLASGLLLIGSWRKLWDDRNQAAGRLSLAIIVGGLALYTLHIFFVVYRDANIFVKLYNINPTVFADELQMTKKAAKELADPMKALHSMALLGGVGLASAIYLWSPWESIVYYANASKNEPEKQTVSFWAVGIKDLAGIAVLVLWAVTYHLFNPLWLKESSLAEQFHNQESLMALLLLLAVGLLFGIQRDVWSEYTTPTGRLRIAVGMGLGLYVLAILAVAWGNSNLISDYYHVDSAVYNSQVLSEAGRIKPLEAADRAALLAGVALASVIYLWSPWERLRLYGQTLRQNVAAIATAILVVAAWEYGVDAFKIEQFLLPKPSVIWETFKEIYPNLIAGGWFTFQNALRGFAIGCGVGILTGIISARFLRFSKAILPLAIAANAVPIIAFAPIANAWFGLTSSNSKVAIVAVLCYFPAMISTVRGLTSVEPIQIELMRSYAASELEIFRHVRLPNALPFIFSALKLATTLAMIGAIVSEYFGGTPNTALGFKIKNDAALLKMTESWSAIIIASLLGIGFYTFVSMMERTAMPWYRSFRSDSR